MIQKIILNLEKRPILFMMIGIPGSGKSTWARNNFKDSSMIVALDVIRRSVYGYFPQELDKIKEEIIWNRAIKACSERLLRGEPVLLDSMALTKIFRKGVVSKIEDLVEQDLTKVAIFLDTPLSVAILRNNNRYKIVNEETIRRMIGYLEPPTYNEGFEQIIKISAKQSAL